MERLEILIRWHNEASKELNIDHSDITHSDLVEYLLRKEVSEEIINKRNYLKSFCDKIYKTHKIGYEALIDGFINEYNEPLSITHVTKCMSCEVDIKKDEGLLFCGECGT